VRSTQRTVDLGDGDATTLEQWGESGPALLFVHGIGSSRKSWVRTAEALAGSYRVFAYDQRGHGDSATIAGPMTHAQSVRDLLAVARAIDGEIFALIGHSWGGTVVLKAGHEVGCVRVIAIDPMIHYVSGQWTADFVDDLVPLLTGPKEARERAVRAMFAGLPAVEVDAKVHALRNMSIEPIVALGAENGADAGKWDVREIVRAYPKPLLLLLADPSDSVVAPEDVAFVRESGGSNVTIDVFEGEGHALHRTAFERFAAAAKTFLGKGPRPR
jgi:pimeloyl-ACP methyl ester carboxylesterase